MSRRNGTSVSTSGFCSVATAIGSVWVSLSVSSTSVSSPSAMPDYWASSRAPFNTRPAPNWVSSA